MAHELENQLVTPVEVYVEAGIWIFFFSVALVEN